MQDAYRRSLVTGIESSVSGNVIESLAYSYDALNRPITRNTDTFGYNDRSEVTSATIGGNANGYGYDEIGNSTSYTANNLNQYTEFAYDLDGNLLTDGVRTFTYDAANRLKTISSNDFLLVTNFYDAKSRRVRKVTPDATTTFFYDDWNLIEERVAYTNGMTSTIRYFWGKNISGTLQGAGGVGGLLYLTVDGTIYVPFYDNNGNITRYLDASGNTVAQYTYDAFGNTISQSGPLANIFHHRFSTKYLDSETNLYYYGYRFYHPILMRWLNRDPLEEEGDVNLYSACENNLINTWDLLGLWSATWASRGEKRRVYKKEKGDTIKGLADKIGMDEKTFHLWARIETTGKANMMQCYSINPNGTMPTRPTATPFNYKKAWENTAVKVYGYEGVNVIGIDF